MTRLVYLAPVAWESFPQRPHKFVEWFHERTGAEVLWLDPYPTRLPEIDDLRRLGSRKCNTAIDIPTPDWLTVAKPMALPIEPLSGSGMINSRLWKEAYQSTVRFLRGRDAVLGVGKPSELALRILREENCATSFYDAMDDFPAFYRGLSRRSMERRQEEIISRVSRIIVSSSALAERFCHHGSKVTLARNACASDTMPLPREAVTGREPAVFGYVGTIGRWFDWDWVIELALQQPTAEVRLIGPMFSPPPRTLPPNVTVEAACRHDAAIEAMRNFSVGIIPFKRNELTRSVDPIKYYEYRALGLPVLSTAFGEMAQRRGEHGIFIVDDPKLIAEWADKALSTRLTRNDVLRFREDNTWHARFNASLLITKLSPALVFNEDTNGLS